jgi:membrane protein DedA with SNARE-associated domain
METILLTIVDVISKLGYFGVFIGMLIESSFIPFPSEIIMIPAGYLAHSGEMNLWAVIIIGTLGSIAGALVNYYLAKFLGRTILTKYGRYFLISEKAIAKADTFFQNHGEISTLTGRLLPVIRQLISIPAGLFRMNLFRFTVLTGIGSFAWVCVLAFFGFFIGKNKELIATYMPMLKVGSILIAVLLVVFYLVYKKYFKK